MEKKLATIESQLGRLEKRMDAVSREVGAQEGRSLYQQINELEKKSIELDNHITQLLRDVQSIRKLVEYGDVRLKEIMKALALIYRNTDDLESNLIEAENINTR